MRRNLFLLAMVVVMITSCRKDETIGGSSNSDAINFSTFVGNQTSRAAVADLTALQTSGFTAFANTTSGTWEANGSESTPDFMYNQNVTFDGRCAPHGR